MGRFLSADPVLDRTDPVQNNGYTYAHNNPVTHSDPSGLSVALTASETAAALAGAGLSSAMIAQAQANMGRSLISVILDSAWYILKEFIGINDALNCFGGGDMWACGSLILNAIPWTKVAKIPAVIRAVNRTINAIQAWQAAKRAAEAVLATARAAEAAALQAKKLAIERAKKAAQAAKKKAADKVNSTSNKATQSAKKTGNAPQKEAQAKSNPKGSSAASGGAGGKDGGGGKGGGGGGKGDSKPGGSSGASNRSNGGSSGNDGGSSGGESCPISNSFVPGTRVLMADGSTKAIEDVKPGDKVVVADPETGRTEVDTVSAAITGDGVKDLVKVVIDTDGDQGSETAEVTATDGHPFWVPELGEWIDATDLQPGQWLQTSAGTYVQITAIDRWSVPRATVHNLTVANTHTYYVLAGNTPVLVHNCGPVPNNRPGDLSLELMEADLAGISPVAAGTSGFSRAASGSGDFLWTVGEGGDLNMVAAGRGIHHTVASGGAPVMAAGQISFRNGAMTSFDNMTGHYTPCSSCAGAFIQRGVDAFGAAGVQIPLRAIRDYGGRAP